MKKLMLIGVVALIGMSSCKTYCPAYAKNTNDAAKAPVTAKVSEKSDNKAS